MRGRIGKVERVTSESSVVVEVSGRPYCVHEEPAGLAPMIGDYDTTLTRHVFESLAASARMCLHVRVLAGRNAHHVHEAQRPGDRLELRLMDVMGSSRRSPGRCAKRLPWIHGWAVYRARKAACD